MFGSVVSQHGLETMEDTRNYTSELHTWQNSNDSLFELKNPAGAFEINLEEIM